MNTRNFTHDQKSSTKSLSACLIACGIALTAIVPQSANAEWKIDLSRRQKSVRETDLTAAAQDATRAPASARVGDEGGGSRETGDGAGSSKGIFDTLFDAGEPVQEVVILNTEKGFVPNQVNVRKNGRYMIHVVNVNEKEKNVSFILDGFSEHHATFYGKVKTFRLEPKKEGVFSFQSPETSAEGRLVVFNPQISVRGPASESAGEGAIQGAGK